MKRFARGVAGICVIVSTVVCIAIAHAQQTEPSTPPAASGQPPDAQPSATGAIMGSVVIDGTAPTAQLEARVSGPDGSERVVPVDASGRFRVPDLAPGTYTLYVADAAREATGAVEVVAGSDAELVLAWTPSAEATAVVASEPAGDMVVMVDRISAAQQLQQSADAVQVIDTRKAKVQSADLGAVLARSQGVGVRREGGLGSVTRFSLNGLSGDQVRFFLDGVPLEFSGYPFGLANVPVTLVDRVEVYRGVVPVRFGTDALGGAVNLVSPQTRHSYLSGSYQIGSFGTHRTSVDGRYLHEPSGVSVAATAFMDLAKNDYKVDVLLPDKDGTLHPRSVPRFHDAYHAYGGTLQVGVQDRPWAKRLLLTGYASTYGKEVQNSITMDDVYGEVWSGQTVYGATAQYDVALSTAVDLALTASYSHRTIDFKDTSRWDYDWLGQRTFERAAVPGGAAGESSDQPSDSRLWQDAMFTRALLSWEISPVHMVRLSLSPAFTTRTGDEHLVDDPAVRDPLSGRSKLFTFITGLEYETNVFDERLSNVLFGKDYVYRAETEQVLKVIDQLSQNGTSVLMAVNKHTMGIGDALRLRMTPWLYVKASYEYASRLPRPDEVFGNGMLIKDNPDLKPEVSHNANLGPRVELRDTPLGDFTLDLNAFLRDSRDLIMLTSEERPSYENVYRVRGVGLENALNWRSPKQWLSVDGTFTWQDIRNNSTEGPFADQKGDRMLNLPYLFGSWSARLHLPGMPSRHDSLEPFYYGRYVHAFFRGWESDGLPSTKQTIPTQVSHDVGVSWLVSRDAAGMTATFEVLNVADAKLYDNFGVQRPGRAFYAKITATLP